MSVAADVVYAFETQLGWMALLIGSAGVKQLSFGQPSPTAAVAALHLDREIEVSAKRHPLVRRLQKYAESAADDFLDIQVDSEHCGPFTARVLDQCRRIPLGETISYRELATRAGSPLAARAVGQAMSHNRVPLIIPCHRVVASGGSLGGYSAPRGLAMKRELLALEAAAVTTVGYAAVAQARLIS